MTSDFERFERSLYRGGGRDAEEFDLLALERLSASERERAEELLVERLKSGDYRAVSALDVLATASALAALRQAVPTARGLLSASLARALLRSDPAAARDAAFEALRSHDDGARTGGVHVLSELAGDDVDAALLAAADDSASSVRHFATEAVFKRWGLSAHQVPRRRLTMLRMRLSSDFDSLRKPAVTELMTTIARLRAEQSPETLGLVEDKPIDSPAYRSWVQSIRSTVDEAPYAEDFDLRALDNLSSQDRAWAELALIGMLASCDPRVPRALGHLNSQLAVEPMRVVQRTIVDGAPRSWLERSRRFVDELARALAGEDPAGRAND